MHMVTASHACGCRLLGLLEANALEGGLLKSMTLLAATPAEGKGVTSLITTIPPCYCSQAVDYGNIFDVYTAWQRNTSVAANKPHTDGAATSMVAGFMSVSKACLSDECKVMMQSVFDFFVGITVGNAEDTICTSENALMCLADAQATTCPEPPAQGRWIGDIADEMGDEIMDTRALPTGSMEAGSGETTEESMWRDLYWTACNMRNTCPDVGVSAYVITTSFTIADAAEVDTPAKIATLIQKFVKYINDKAGANVLMTWMVTATVTNNRRRGRSLAAATVALSIETTNELAKQQVTKVTDDTSTTTTTELSTSLGVQVSRLFTTSEVATVTYPPPPPAPGYKDNAAGGGGDDDGPNIALIAGIVAGVGGCALLVVIAVLVAMLIKKKKNMNTSPK